MNDDSKAFAIILLTPLLLGLAAMCTNALVAVLLIGALMTITFFAKPQGGAC